MHACTLMHANMQPSTLRYYSYISSTSYQRYQIGPLLSAKCMNDMAWCIIHIQAEISPSGKRSTAKHNHQQNRTLIGLHHLHKQQEAHN